MRAVALLVWLVGHGGVARALSLGQEPKDATVGVGGATRLHCDTPTEGARIVWRHSSNEGASFEVIDGGDGEAAHPGWYRCEAVHPRDGVLVSRVARVTLATLPDFAAQPKDLHLHPGQTAFFACAVKDSAAVYKHTQRNKPFSLQVVWLKNEAPFHLDETRMTLMPSGALQIDTVDKHDRGTYRCNISLSGVFGHRLSEAARLIISDDYTPLDSNVSPVFIAEPRSQSVIEGSSVTMDCAALGSPDAEISWLHAGNSIDLNNLDSRFTLLGSGVLFINPVKEADSGSYQCRASGKEDSLDATAFLDVQVPPRFVKKPQNVVAPERDDIVLECKIYGKPEPIVHWLKNGETIYPNNHDMTLFSGHNLRIQGLMLTDAGMFQCIGSNSVGNIQAAARLEVIPSGIRNAFEDVTERDEQDKLTPSEPVNLTAVIIRPRFIILSWNEPQILNGEIEAYTIIYKVNNSSRERMINTTRKDIHEMNVSQLRPNTNYQFRVVASNKNGAGLSSQPIYVTTQSEDQSLGPPLDLEVSNVTSTSMDVFWQPPKHVPGSKLIAEKYQMFWTKVTEQEILSSDENSIITENLYHHLGNLTPFSEYGIRVVALSDSSADSADGTGTPTKLIFIKTNGDIPSLPPQNVTYEAVASTSIKATWEPPPLNTQNGEITGYKLRYKKLGRKKPSSFSTAANARSAVLKDLEPMATYQVRICAFNINGSGPYSEWQNVETFQNDLDEQQVPGTPGPINVKAGIDSIYVSWVPPQNQNVRIRHYKLSWGKGVPDDDRKVLSESARSHSIKNLDRNSEYVITLTALNDIGGGIPAYATTRTLEKTISEVDPEETDIETIEGGISNVNLQSIFSPPVGLQADILSGTTAVVYWTDITLPKSQIVIDQRFYVVKYSIVGSHKFKYFNTTNLNCMIDDLKPNTKYEFSVKMVKGNRETPWSMVVINSTLEAPPTSFPRDVTITPTDGTSSSVTIHWQPPSKANGVITGYVILHTTDRNRRDRDWVVQAVVGGGTSALVRSLKPTTTYYFKVQARNTKGYGPFSPIVTFTTSADISGDGEELASSKEMRHNHSLILYGIIGVIAIFVVVGVIVTAIICCRKTAQPPLSPDTRSKSTYQKSSTSNIKPPDLWIHHDQMELKQMDKSHHSSTGSGDGSSAISSMTLQRPPPRDSCEYDTAMPGGGSSLHHASNTGSLDKRHYVPTYVAMSSINTCNTSGHGIGDVGSNSSAIRSLYPRPQFSLGSNSRPHLTIDQNTPLLSAAGSSISGTLPSQSSMSSLGQLGSSLPLHHHSITGSLGISPMSCSQMSCGGVPGGSIMHGPSSPSPSPASEGFPADAREREQGHYVAYEALHPPKESIDAASGMSSLNRNLPGAIHPLRSFSVPAPPPNEAPHTPHHHNKVSVTIRPTNTSPYKKSSMMNAANPSALPISSLNRLQHGISVPHSAEEVEALAPSHSTERLHQEMANLEGLMKDLSAITASQFEC